MSVQSRRLVQVALAVLAATLLVPGPADASPVAASFTVPASGTFTVIGHGWGHGHGMSQWGARGAAREGLSVRQILAFYYPGTKPATYDGTVTVRISADTTRDVQVRVQPGLSVGDRGTGKFHRLPAMAGVTRWRLGVSGTHAVVDYFRKGWHAFKVAGHRNLVGDGVFKAPSNVLTLVTPTGDKVLRGRLRAASPAKGSTDRDTVDVLSLESYVRGVVPAEMPASWNPAAVQAQAIAARTYALFERAANIHRYYELCDTSACQVYRGVAVEDPDSDAAVRTTVGQYLAYGGQPAFTQFSSSDGGWTSAGSFPYLPHQADPYDDTAGNPVHDWSVVAKASTLEKRYPKIGDLSTITVTEREGGGDWGGRARTVVLIGSTGSATITGDDFRSALGLRSSWFDLGA